MIFGEEQKEIKIKDTTVALVERLEEETKEFFYEGDSKKKQAFFAGLLVIIQQFIGLISEILDLQEETIVKCINRELNKLCSIKKE